MNNPIEMIKGLMGKGESPQQMITNMISQNSNPMMQNLMKMAQNGNTQEVENFARNICKEKGIDFDKEFSNFMKQIR
ncbi:MAG TPA: hypothetical protein IAB40_06290 [Candidatus Onthocola stercoravium]|nr:hypothetical protein [Candidatus Onthocola stercoravium]